MNGRRGTRGAGGDYEHDQKNILHVHENDGTQYYVYLCMLVEIFPKDVFAYSDLFLDLFLCISG